MARLYISNGLKALLTKTNQIPQVQFPHTPILLHPYTSVNRTHA